MYWVLLMAVSPIPFTLPTLTFLNFLSICLVDFGLKRFKHARDVLYVWLYHEQLEKLRIARMRVVTTMVALAH